MLVGVFHGCEVDHVQYLIGDSIDLATVMKKRLELDAARLVVSAMCDVQEELFLKFFWCSWGRGTSCRGRIGVGG